MEECFCTQSATAETEALDCRALRTRSKWSDRLNDMGARRLSKTVNYDKPLTMTNNSFTLGLLHYCIIQTKLQGILMKKLTKELWVEKAREVHGDKYDYSQAVYTLSTNKLTIVCPEHGPFEQVANCHTAGKQGCPACGVRKNRSYSNAVEAAKSTFLQRVADKHGDLLDLSKFEYVNSKTDGIVICKKHGEFLATPNFLLTKRAAGCPKCGRDRIKEYHETSWEEFIEKAQVIHPTYEFLRESFVNSSYPIRFICPEHGEQEVKQATWMLSTRSPSICPRCAREAVGAFHRKGFAAWLVDAVRMHGDTYEYPEQELKTTRDPVRIICKKHGVFHQIASNHSSHGAGCPKCTNNQTSKMEERIFSELAGLVGDDEVLCNYRKALNGKEIDLYIPKAGIGVELHGLYWHSEEKAGTTKHLEKLKLAEEKDIKLMQFFEDEVIDRYVAVLHAITLRAGFHKPIYARKCELKEVGYSDTKEFYDTWHLQGSIKSASKHFALYHEGELVAAAAFGGSRFKKGEVELLRWCCTRPVVGGLSKVMKHCGYDKVVSFQDLRLWGGETYAANGFKLLYKTRPGYYWAKGLTRTSRFKTRGAGERERMESQGYWRVWDCGQAKWEWTRATS